MMKAMLASSSKTWLEEVQADSPLGVWLLQEASGTTLTATVGSNGTYPSSAMTYRATGPGKAALPYGATFSTLGATLPVNLSSYSVATIEMWLTVASWPAGGGIILEYGTDYNATDGLATFTTGTTLSTQIHEGVTAGTKYKGATATTPSTGAWHHLVFTYDRFSPWTHGVYVDGAAVSTSPFSSGAAPSGSNFANRNLYLMARNTTLAPRAGTVAGVAVYGTVLSAARVAAHYAGA